MSSATDKSTRQDKYQNQIYATKTNYDQNLLSFFKKILNNKVQKVYDKTKAYQIKLFAIQKDSGLKNTM